MSDNLREETPDEPFSRPLAAAEVPEEGLETSIAADEKEREALARADDLEALTRLEAKLRVTREGRGGLRVVGEFVAELRQTCVVTLEEFDARLVEPIDIAFAPETDTTPAPSPDRMSRRRRAAEPPAPKEPRTSRHIADLDEDAPDPLVDGRIDLGAIVAEFLALALDPYPRKPGARFDQPDEQAGEKQKEPPKASPFAGLREALGKPPGKPLGRPRRN